MSTGIQWTDATWNPVTGCQRVSAGCANCYAQSLHNMRYRKNVQAALEVAAEWRSSDGRHLRSGSMPQAIQQLRKNGHKLPFSQQYDTPFAVVQTWEHKLLEPLRWRKPKRVFVNSMSDLFHEDVPEAFLDRVFAVMALTPHITYQVLTKRPERMRRYMKFAEYRDADGRSILPPHISKIAEGWSATGKRGIEAEMALERLWVGVEWPLPNVWLGTSVEDQAAADARIPELLATPAVVRFLSCEPLLGPVDLCDWWVPQRRYLEWASAGGPNECAHGYAESIPCPKCPKVDWVIAGGESGPKARPCDIAWIRDIVRQCQTAGVPAFVKQLGSKPYYEVDHTPDHLREMAARHGVGPLVAEVVDPRLRHPHGGNPEEWPEDLRIREFPAVAP